MRMWIALVAIYLISALFGCERSDNAELLWVVLRADPGTAAKVEAMLAKQPEVVNAKTNTTYSLKVIPMVPFPKVEWSLLQVVPDDKLVYSIRFFDSTTGKALPKFNEQLAPVLRERMIEREGW